MSFLPSLSIFLLPSPSKSCLQIERLMRNFPWSADPDRLRSNPVRWKIVCLPKSVGGLGLQRLKEFNEDCLLKITWSAITVDSLWAEWFRARYFRGALIWYFRNPRSGSCIWKKLRSLSFLLQRDSRWVEGNGQSISLWFDNWIDHDPTENKCC